jgi:uncharacterized integral membrane protein
MQVLLLVALVVALIAVVFALQNVGQVTLAFLTWTLEGSLALVLFVALIAGALVSILASVPTLVRQRLTAASLKKRVAALEAELEGCRRTLAATQTPASPPTRPISEDIPLRNPAPHPE